MHGYKEPFDDSELTVGEAVLLSEQLREKIVELMVRVEHLKIFSTYEGMHMFGKICEMTGRICQHLAEGRRGQALKIAQTVGRSVPHAFPFGPERDALEESLEEIIGVLESPDVSNLH